MTSKPFKNVIIAGASGTIGAPITKKLLSHGGFNVSVLSRPESKATFPDGVTLKKVELASKPQLIEAFKGQDILICTLNDATAELQPIIIEAAFEAGVKRVLQNEWASHEMTVPNTPMDGAKAGKKAIVELLQAKVQEAEAAGREFHVSIWLLSNPDADSALLYQWTGINNGTFFDWSLHAAFIDITLPPTKTALIWDSGDNLTTFTNLSTVAAAVLAVLTTAEVSTRDRLLNIESFAATPNQVVSALEKATGETWTVEKTTTEAQLKLAQESLESGDFLPALYRWIKTYIFSDDSKLPDIQNELLGLPKEDLQSSVEKVIRGEEI